MVTTGTMKGTGHSFILRRPAWPGWRSERTFDFFMALLFIQNKVFSSELFPFWLNMMPTPTWSLYEPCCLKRAGHEPDLRLVVAPFTHLVFFLFSAAAQVSPFRLSSISRDWSFWFWINNLAMATRMQACSWNRRKAMNQSCQITRSEVWIYKLKWPLSQQLNFDQRFLHLLQNYKLKPNNRNIIRLSGWRVAVHCVCDILKFISRQHRYSHTYRIQSKGHRSLHSR